MVKKKKGKGKKRRLQLDNLTCKPHNTHHQPSLFSIHTKPREVCPDNKSSAPFLINPHPPSPPPFLEERREGRCEFWGCGGAGKRQPGNQDPKKLRTITLGLLHLNMQDLTRRRAEKKYIKVCCDLVEPFTWECGVFTFES